MSNVRFLEAILGGPVLADGAMGTMLQWHGMDAGECPELWNVEHPDAVKHVCTAYVEAGSDVISTNTFGGTRIKLACYGLENRAAELNAAGVSLARHAAGDECFVMASLGPTGQFLEPLGNLRFADVSDAFAEAAGAQASAGADAILLETFSDLDELKAALEGARRSGLPCLCTMAFDTGGRTMMGVRPSSAASELTSAGADGVGANCGVGPEGMLQVISEIRASTDIPVIAQPNAGLPKVMGGQVVYDATPAELAGFAVECARLGVNVVGACCGSTPDHIREMKKRLKV